MSRNFFDFFPTPRFISMPSAGLSLLSPNVSFVNLVKGKDGRLILKDHGLQEIPSSVLENGDIKNHKELINILSDFRKRHDLSFIRVSLPEEKTFLFRTSVPKMSDLELREALRFKIEENVPLSASESQFDFQVVSGPANIKEGELQVLVAVVADELVQSYLSVFKESGFQPLLFGLEPQALAKAVIKDRDTRPFVLVNALSGKVGLYIVDEGLVQFTATLPLQENFLSSVTSTHMDEMRVQLIDRAGGQISSVQDKGIDTSDDKPDDTKVYIKKMDAEKTLRNETNNLIDYWKSFLPSQNFSNPSNKHGVGKAEIEKIIICGDKEIRQKLKNYFSSYFSIPVEFANVWSNAFSFDSYIPDLDFEESFKYAVSIGMALSS